MDPELSPFRDDCSFEFAFNCRNFSDRVLWIEIVKESAAENGLGHRNQGMDPDGLQTNGSSCSTECCSNTISTKPIYVCSAILAAKSPFFFKLFSNGMIESQQRETTLRINPSEEAALMELLDFMYTGKLSSTSPSLLLDVLMAADKFEVASCVHCCSQLLRNLTMTKESALLYLELPSSVSQRSIVKPLTNAARDFLINSYKNLIMIQDEVMDLPVAGIEAILSGDELQVDSEDAIYDFVLRWSRMHYPKSEERREILETRLLGCIRFAHMSCRKLREVLSCTDFDYRPASRVVLEALFFKTLTAHRQSILAKNEKTSKTFAKRAYRYHPLKGVEFVEPYPRCIVYLDLKREECDKLFPSGRVYSQAFKLGEQGFFLWAECGMNQQRSSYCFGIFLGMHKKDSLSVPVEYEFAVRTRHSGHFVTQSKDLYTFTGETAVGCINLFDVLWTVFMAEDSFCFINSILHLRAELAIPSLAPSR